MLMKVDLGGCEHFVSMLSTRLLLSIKFSLVRTLIVHWPLWVDELCKLERVALSF